MPAALNVLEPRQLLGVTSRAPALGLFCCGAMSILGSEPEMDIPQVFLVANFALDRHAGRRRRSRARAATAIGPEMRSPPLSKRTIFRLAWRACREPSGEVGYTQTPALIPKLSSCVTRQAYGGSATFERAAPLCRHPFLPSVVWSRHSLQSHCRPSIELVWRENNLDRLFSLSASTHHLYAVSVDLHQPQLLGGMHAHEADQRFDGGLDRVIDRPAADAGVQAGYRPPLARDDALDLPGHS